MQSERKRESDVIGFAFTQKQHHLALLSLLLGVAGKLQVNLPIFYLRPLTATKGSDWYTCQPLGVIS